MLVFVFVTREVACSIILLTWNTSPPQNAFAYCTYTYCDRSARVKILTLSVAFVGRAAKLTLTDLFPRTTLHDHQSQNGLNEGRARRAELVTSPKEALTPKQSSPLGFHRLCPRHVVRSRPSRRRLYMYRNTERRALNRERNTESERSPICRHEGIRSQPTQNS